MQADGLPPLGKPVSYETLKPSRLKKNPIISFLQRKQQIQITLFPSVRESSIRSQMEQTQQSKIYPLDRLSQSFYTLESSGDFETILTSQPWSYLILI